MRSPRAGGPAAMHRSARVATEAALVVACLLSSVACAGAELEVAATRAGHTAEQTAMPPAGWLALLAGIANAVLLTRRRRSSLVATVGIMTLTTLLPTDGAAALACWWSVGRRWRGRAWWWAGGAAALAISASLVRDALRSGTASFQASFREGVDVPWPASVLIGVAVVALVGLVARRPQRAPRSAAAPADDASTPGPDTAWLVRELHDVLGGRLAQLSLHAGALELAAADDETRASARVIRETAGQAVDELQRLLSALRERAHRTQAMPAVPAPDWHARVSAMVREAMTAGANVEFAVGPGALPELTPEQGAALCHVVREALTNAHRYAPQGAARVEARVVPDDAAVPGARRLEVAVLNRVPSEYRDRVVPARGSGGSGLAGLAERVAASGGAFRSGFDLDGRFGVHAGWPLTVGVTA